MSSPNDPHRVITGPIGESLPQVLEELTPSRVFVVVDDNTAEHCLPVLRKALDGAPDCGINSSTTIVTLSAGELHKTVDATKAVWDALIEARADRHALLVNLGGGVVTDLGGFAAGCYKRGIRFVHLPTTVLGQVDAAIGGKTGVDFGGVKNSVGLFRMPEAVLADPIFLRTLSEREVRSGMAEMYKHALISDPEHWAELKATGGDLLAQPNAGSLIARSQRIKLDIVAEDPHEQGIREALNLGHSVGHALESVLLTTTNPALHGEAVAAGCICEAYISEELSGLSAAEVADIEATLTQVYGTLQLHADQIASVLGLVANDKKNRGGTTRMSLLNRIGEARLGVGVSPAAIERALLRYGVL